jgi:hypothetical protein
MGLKASLHLDTTPKFSLKPSKSAKEVIRHQVEDIVVSFQYQDQYVF